MIGGGLLTGCVIGSALVVVLGCGLSQTGVTAHGVRPAAPPPATRESAPAPEIPPLRCATFNIHAGTAGVEKLARAIAALDIDVIGLQEVDVGTARVDGEDLANELGRRLHYHVAFGKALDLDGGGYGVAVLAREPLTEPRSWPLPAGPGAEPRVMLVAQIDHHTERWTVAVTHLASHLDGDFADQVRLAQARKVAERLGGRERTVLLGDLNADVGDPALVPISIVGSFVGLEGGATFPARVPVKRLDHIVASPDLYPVTARVVDTGLSDHRVVVAHLAPRRPLSP